MTIFRLSVVPSQSIVSENQVGAWFDTTLDSEIARQDSQHTYFVITYQLFQH
jgi:hypothetical protein